MERRGRLLARAVLATRRAGLAALAAPEAPLVSRRGRKRHRGPMGLRARCEGSAAPGI